MPHPNFPDWINNNLTIEEVCDDNPLQIRSLLLADRMNPEDNWYGECRIPDQEWTTLQFAVAHTKPDFEWTLLPQKVTAEELIPPFYADRMTLIPAQYIDPSRHYIKKYTPVDEDECEDDETPLSVQFANLSNRVREIATCEKLREYPHPNVCGYFGVKTNAVGTRVEGIVLQKFHCDLKDLVPDHMNLAVAATAIRDIEAGIKHMHSLGAIHCDIKPQNVFVRYTLTVYAPGRQQRDVRFAVGDFDSVHARGATLLGKNGTIGWAPNEEDADTATPELDFFGLAQIKRWLRACLSGSTEALEHILEDGRLSWIRDAGADDVL